MSKHPSQQPPEPQAPPPQPVAMHRPTPELIVAMLPTHSAPPPFVSMDGACVVLMYADMDHYAARVSMDIDALEPARSEAHEPRPDNPARTVRCWF